MEPIRLTLGYVGTNCYILPTEKGNAVVIDPGDDAARISSVLEEKNLFLTDILLTHGHVDHILACAELKKQWNARIWIHEEDAEMVADKNKCGAYLLPRVDFNHFTPDTLFSDSDEIYVDNLCFRVLHTPGHSKGSSCFLLDDLMFSGDTLFLGTVGRTDLYGGDYFTLTKSLHVLMDLEKQYTVYPGHGESTTLAYECANNPYLRNIFDL